MEFIIQSSVDTVIFTIHEVFILKVIKSKSVI